MASALFRAVRAGDVEAVRRLLAGGANPRATEHGETPLHVAARRGPLALVEALIAGGALEWQGDEAGRSALDVARAGTPADREQIVHLLDRPVIDDPMFRAAVAAIHRGDAEELAALIDREPRLVRERIVEPDAYHAADRYQYFLDPKLVWFVADNPNLVDPMPPNIVAVTQVMIERGAERADLSYALALVMTSRPAREAGVQAELMRTLLAGGAEPTTETIVVTAAHGELDALRALLAAGVPLTLEIAASLGDLDAVRAALPEAPADAVQAAFGLAVLNGRLAVAEAALAHGADVNGRIPVHTHGTALHHAAGAGDVPMIRMLLAHGARLDTRDGLWSGTPLEWAMYAENAAAGAELERALNARR